MLVNQPLTLASDRTLSLDLSAMGVALVLRCGRLLAFLWKLHEAVDAYRGGKPTRDPSWVQ